jgi:hypothetical protein
MNSNRVINNSDPISLANKLRCRAISHTAVVATVQRTKPADPSAMVAEYNVARAKHLTAL